MIDAFEEYRYTSFMSLVMFAKTPFFRCMKVEIRNSCHQVSHHFIFRMFSRGFWTQDRPYTSSSVPFTVKKNIIEAYLLMKRSKEEQQLLIIEMKTALEFWSGRVESLRERISTANSTNDLYSRGAAAIIQQHLWITDLTRSRAEAAFQSIFDQLSQHTLTESDESSDTDSDNNSEDAYVDSDD